MSNLRLWRLWVVVGAFALAACNAPQMVSTSTAEVAEVDAPTLPFSSPTAQLTPNTTTPTATTELPDATPTPASTATETLTPSPSPTITPTLRPTINPNQLPTPPPTPSTITGHLIFARPVVGNNSPASNYRFGMTFDYRLAPHHGVDMANPEGTPVLAVGPGEVYYAGSDIDLQFGPSGDFYGNVIVIRHDQLWENRVLYTLYGHLQQTSVETGQRVNTGDLIGLIGSTGIALQPHLHFEVRIDDPESYFAVRNPELWYLPLEPRRGALAGRILDVRGRYLPGHRVFITCQDGVRREVQTYWYEGTAPDDILGENFGLNDLPSGTCVVETGIDGVMLSQAVQVTSNNLTFLVMQSSGGPATR